MNVRTILPVLLLPAALSAQSRNSIPAPAQIAEVDAAMYSIRAAAIRGDMRFLADDLLEGRGTDTRGHEIAAKFMAAQFESMGLSPAGEGATYFQRVPLRTLRVNQADGEVTLIQRGQEVKLAPGKDFLQFGDPGRADVLVEAPAVYVGFGVTAPEEGYDDYKGIDVRGKLATVVYGAPHFESAVRAHYTAPEVKASIAAAHGAVGMLWLYDPMLENMIPFQAMARYLAFPAMRWLDKDKKPNSYFPQLKGTAMLSLAASRRFIDGSGRSADEVFQAVKDGKPSGFSLQAAARIHSTTALGDGSSPNVVARLDGSDPLLKNEFVVYSAHLDHLGIGDA